MPRDPRAQIIDTLSYYQEQGEFDGSFSNAKEVLASAGLPSEQLPTYMATLRRMESEGDLEQFRRRSGNMQPNRALNRHQLETIAWQVTPEGERRGSGSRREVLVKTSQGMTSQPLADMTDNQIRRYIGPRALEEGGDMKHNGRDGEFKPTEKSGKRVDWLYDKRDNTRLVYITKEPDGMYYVWIRQDLDGRPDWTYGYRTQALAKQEMERLGGYSKDDPNESPYARLRRLRTQTPNGKGIYSGSSANQDDYVIHQHGTSGKYFVDRVARGGTHVKIGGAKGVSSIAEAKDIARNDAFTRGRGTGAIFEQDGEELLETDSVGSYFVLGDQVCRVDDPSYVGKVSYVGSYQGYEYGGYQYKVDWDNGAPRHYVPENKLRLLKGHEAFSKNGSRSKYSPTEPYGHGVSRSDVFSPGERVTYTFRGERREGEVIEVFTETIAVREDGGSKKMWPIRDTRASALSKNASRTEPDETAARELSLYIENDYSLVGAPNSQGKQIEKNLLAKIRNGSFTLEKSELAWMYLMETGAKQYCKEFSGTWSVMFNKATRELVAHEFATTFYAENKGSR